MLQCYIHVWTLLAFITLGYKVTSVEASYRDKDYDGSQSFEFSRSYEPDVTYRHHMNNFHKSKSWSGESIEFQKHRRSRTKTVKVDVKVSIPVHHHHHHHYYSYQGRVNALEKRKYERDGNRNSQRNRKEPARHNNRQHPAKHGRGIVPSKKQNAYHGESTNEKETIPTIIALTEYVTDRMLLSTAPAGNHEPSTEKTFAIVTTQTPKVEFTNKTEPITDNPIIVTEKEHITSTTEKEITKTTEGTTIKTMNLTTEKLITIPTTTGNSHVAHTSEPIYITPGKPQGRVMQKAHEPSIEKAFVTIRTPRVEFTMITEPTTDNPITVTENTHHIISTTEKTIPKTTEGTPISTVHPITMQPTTEKLITIPATTKNPYVAHTTETIHIIPGKPQGRVMQKAHEPSTEKTFVIVTTQTSRVEFTTKTESTTDNPISVTEKDHHITFTTEKSIPKPTKGTAISTMHPTTDKLITETFHVLHTTESIHIATDKPQMRVMEEAHQHTTTEETVKTTAAAATPPPIVKRRRKYRPTEKSAHIDHVDQVTKATRYYVEGENFQEIVHITHAPIKSPRPQIEHRFKLKKRVDGKEGVDIRTLTDYPNSSAGSSWSRGADRKQKAPIGQKIDVPFHQDTGAHDQPASKSDTVIEHKTEVAVQRDLKAPTSSSSVGQPVGLAQKKVNVPAPEKPPMTKKILFHVTQLF